MAKAIAKPKPKAKTIIKSKEVFSDLLALMKKSKIEDTFISNKISEFRKRLNSKSQFLPEDEVSINLAIDKLDVDPDMKEQMMQSVENDWDKIEKSNTEE